MSADIWQRSRCLSASVTAGPPNSRVSGQLEPQVPACRLHLLLSGSSEFDGAGKIHPPFSQTEDVLGRFCVADGCSNIDTVQPDSACTPLDFDVALDISTMKC